MTPNGASGDQSFLVVGVGSRLVAFSVGDVEETTRALPIEPVPGAPAYVVGVAIIRGAPVPVVALSTMLGIPAGQPPRFVTLKVGSRKVAVAVDTVHGVRQLTASSVERIAPLLGGVDRAAVDALGTTDAQLVLVLSAARLLPESGWTAPDLAV